MKLKHCLDDLSSVAVLRDSYANPENPNCSSTKRCIGLPAAEADVLAGRPRVFMSDAEQENAKTYQHPIRSGSD